MRNKFVEVKDITKELEGKRYIIVGDLHGELKEFDLLLEKLEFDYENDIVISLGDLMDRGDDSLGILNLFMRYKNWYQVQGNHDNKFLRFLKGSKVQITDGLGKTIEQCEHLIDISHWRNLVIDYFENLPYIIKIKDMYLVHAGFDPTRPPEQQYKNDCIYQRYYGGKNYFDDIQGKYWFKCLPDNYPTTFSGHEVHQNFENVRETLTQNYIQKEFGGAEINTNRMVRTDYLLDGGCAFGGELRAYDSRDQKVHFIKSLKVSG